MRKLLVGLLAAIACVLGVASPITANGIASAAASPTTSPESPSSLPESDGDTAAVPPVDVLQVEGLLDAIVAARIVEAIDDAAAQGSQALILQVDSQGAVISDGEMANLLNDVRDAPLPVAVWVGPSGSRLTGTSAQLLAVADVTAMAPGSTVGFVGAPVDPSIDLGPGLSELKSRTVGLSEARSLDVFKQRISDEGVPTLANMMYALDGYEKDGVVLDTTTETVTDSGTVQRETKAVPRFFKLDLIDQMFHTVASPAVAYLLLLVGLSLILFEFYTAGIGIAAVIGASCTILAATGLAALPTNGVAIALVVAAMFAFAIDVQVGLPRLWTAVGMVLITIASFTMFGSVGGASLRPGWITLVAGIGGMALAFYVGMPLMTRTRFGTQSIDRDWMVGSGGTVVTALDPDGVVAVDGGEWRGRLAEGTLPAGADIEVTGVDDVTLLVAAAGTIDADEAARSGALG